MENKNIIKFGIVIDKLKKVKRTGWKRRGVDEPESVADHSFGAALLGMALSDMKGMDTEKIIRMLLLHDIQEALSGDISALEKEKMSDNGKTVERNSLLKILKDFPDDLKEKYLSLWDEMEELETKEAKFCKDIDKLEMMIQAFDYEKEDEKKKENLKVFWEREDINTPKYNKFLMEIYETLRKQKGIK